MSNSERRLLRSPGNLVVAEFALAIAGRERRADPNGYYRDLGLDVNLPWLSSDIKRAFRNKAKLYHPDGAAPDVVMYDRIQVAWSVLGDAALRERYDRLDGVTKWLDKFVIQEVIRKLAAVSKPEVNLIEILKNALRKEEMVQNLPRILIEQKPEQHAFYHYEDETPPSLVVREKWIELVKVSMWNHGLGGQEVKIGFSFGPSHVVRKAWGTVLICGGEPSITAAQRLVNSL